MPKPITWLDRRISAPGPYLCLCLTEGEFLDAMKQLRCYSFGSWVTEGSDATTHHLANGNGARVCVVAVSNLEDRSGIEIAGILVHEAVHVWQEYCNQINEISPGSEQEAYAIQAIAQELMEDYARRIK